MYSHLTDSLQREICPILRLFPCNRLFRGEVEAGNGMIYDPSSNGSAIPKPKFLPSRPDPSEKPVDIEAG